MPADGFFPPNIFEEHAGHFWGILDTRDYMRSLIGLAEAQFNMKTTKAVQAGLNTCMEMHRLCRGDNLGVRQITPIQMMRLGQDQKAYDFMKWYYKISGDSHYDWGDISLPYLNLEDEDVFEPVHECTDMDHPSLSEVVPMALFKLRLLIDLQSLAEFNDLMEDMKIPLPQEIQDEIRKHLAGSVVSKKKALLESPEDVFLCMSDLEEMIEIYFDLVHDANQHFWPALLNPDQQLEEYPPYTSAGNEFEMQVALRYIYPAFVETPGAMRIVREWWEKVRDHAV